MKSFVRISALLWADILVLYVMFVMQNYLTDVWEISITHAAGIINIWNGISMILPVFFLFLVDAFLGHFMMLVISSIAYSVGIGFVAMSIPPVLGTCKEYKSDCIGETQKVLFYVGMALLAVGMAGHVVSVKPFLEEQQDDKKISRLIFWQILGLFIVAIVSVIAAIALPYIKPWTVRFGIPAICTLVSTLVFLSGGIWNKYTMIGAQGSPITNICRVFVAFAFKSSESFPEDANMMYKKDEKNPKSLTRTRFLRRLEKAAIILPGISRDEQVKNRWKLCSVSEVEEAKIAVRMVPMWLTFIVCGIVSSIGNTYFIEQASKMNRRIGKWNVPLPALMLLSELAKNLFGKIANAWLLEESEDPNDSKNSSSSKYSKKSKNSSKPAADQVPIDKKKRPPVGIGIAMVFAILCCITAARIEKKRLNVIRKHDLLDKPDEEIPMSIYWLLFQFFLLAGLDTFCEKSVTAFYVYQAPDSMKNYLQYFCKGVFGLGFMSSVLSVYVVGKISEKGGKSRNWFQFTLNRSRLDKYYFVLAGLSSVNLLVFVVVALFYRYKEIEKEDQKEEVEAGIDGVEGELPADQDNNEDQEGQ